MKTVSIVVLEALLQMLVEKEGTSYDHAGMGEVSAMVGEEKVSQRYLYDCMSKIEQAKENRAPNTVRLQVYKLDALAQYLGFERFSAFEQSIATPISPILTNSVGSWYCYVRRNAPITEILQSPAQIVQEGRQFYLEVTGPNNALRGQLLLNNGCLFCHLKAANGKQFQHVYKIGNALSAKVLQGTFAGISSSNDPIGGRVVLMKSELPFEQLERQALAVKDTNNDALKALFAYFNTYEENNLKLLPSITFDLPDLLDD